MARQAWAWHQYGIGIFTIQGYKWRLKELKSCTKWFNNNKQQKITKFKRLWDKYFYEIRK